MRNLVGRILAFVRPVVPQDSLKVQTVEHNAQREVMAMANCLADAFREKDLSQLLDMMTDDVVLLSASGPPTVGRDSAKKLCTDVFGKFDIRQHVDFSVQVVAGIENAASIHGAYVLTLTPMDGGAPVTMRGRLVTVLRHENGAWKLARGVNWVGWVVLPT